MVADEWQAGGYSGGDWTALRWAGRSEGGRDRYVRPALAGNAGRAAEGQAGRILRVVRGRSFPDAAVRDRRSAWQGDADGVQRSGGEQGADVHGRAVRDRLFENAGRDREYCEAIAYLRSPRRSCGSRSMVQEIWQRAGEPANGAQRHESDSSGREARVLVSR